MANRNLNQAKSAKQDEFYTQLSDIENELRHYKQHFKGKIVLCNCDDPRVSNFFHYFSYNFEQLGLKKLITTCYKSQERDLFSSNDSERAIWLEYNGDRNGNRVPDPEEIGIHYFNGDGDFRSPECVKLLKEADIVVTNPPFSLFREYMSQLIRYDKKFVIIGNQNALHYKEIFPLVQQNKVWLGYNHVKEFNKPDGTIQKFGNIIWYTNLDILKRHENIVLYKRYTSAEYPTYYNYDGIDIGKISEIPVDYFGNMGVPDSFLEVYNPEQFEIIGVGTDVPKNKEHISYKDKNLITYEVNGEIVWSTEYSISERKAGNSLRLNDNGNPGRLPYSRIIIRRRKQDEAPMPMAAEGNPEYGE